MSDLLLRLSAFFKDFDFSDIINLIKESIFSFSDNYENILKLALNQSLYMSFLSVFFGFLLALLPGICLWLFGKNGLSYNKFIYSILDFIINLLRAFPFLILIVILLPLSRLLVGTSIGMQAAVVPLSIGISPYLAKMLESAFNEINKGIIEAAKSYGASKIQIIFKVLFVEAFPSIINGLTLTLIFTIGFSALAGTVGAGGLGDVAIRYGYERFDEVIMLQTVVLLIVLVELVQLSGNIFFSFAKNNKSIYIAAILFVVLLGLIALKILEKENFMFFAVLALLCILVLFVYYKNQRIFKKKQI